MVNAFARQIDVEKKTEMSSFLSYIAEQYGVKPEDVATDVVAYLISKTHLQGAIRKLMSEIGFTRLGTDISVRSRKRDQGRVPDICLIDRQVKRDETRAIIENKFWSGLTLNQPCGYVNALAEGGLLLFVVPEPRRRYIWEAVASRCRAEFGSFEPTEHPFCAQTGDRLVAILSWDQLVDVFEKGAKDSEVQLFVDQLRRLCKLELRKFSDLKAAVNRRTDKDVALAVYDLMNLAELLAQRAQDDGLFERLGRLSDKCDLCSSGTYGHIGTFKAWIGFDARLWSQSPLEGWYGSSDLPWPEPPRSPLWIYFDQPGELVRLRAVFCTGQRNLKCLDEGDQLAIPIWLDVESEVDIVLDRAVKQVREVRDLFRGM